MFVGFGIAVGVLTLTVIVLIIKIITLKKGMRQLLDDVDSIVTQDTNALLETMSGDTDLKQLAAELNRELSTLRKLKIKYEHGDRQVKNAITNISHDLRTPLTAIVGYIGLLENSHLQEEQKKHLSIIKKRTEELSSLTEELFRYALTANDEMSYCAEEVCINDVLEESLLSFYAVFKEKGIEPTYDITAVKVKRTTNRQALSRIFSNIISNALKYSEQDFCVAFDSSGIVTFSNRATLSKLDVEHLFDRYFTVKSNTNSTGLGLSIARLLSDSLGFEIAASHENGVLKISIKL